MRYEEKLLQPSRMLLLLNTSAVKTSEHKLIRFQIIITALNEPLEQELCLHNNLIILL